MRQFKYTGNPECVDKQGDYTGPGRVSVTDPETNRKVLFTLDQPVGVSDGLAARIGANPFFEDVTPEPDPSQTVQQPASVQPQGEPVTADDFLA